MSVECPECERDARSGHDKGCKLAKKRRKKRKVKNRRPDGSRSDG